MSIEGTLDDLRVPDILQMVAQQGKTGILTVQGEETIIAVSFLSGDVVAADSLQETVEERLGEVLVREGKLTRDEFGEAVARQGSVNGRLVDLLVDEGYLTRQDVLDSLRTQTRDLMAELMDWTAGDFKFYGNDEVAYEEGFRPIVVEDLLISLLPEETGGTLAGGALEDGEPAPGALGGDDAYAGAYSFGDSPTGDAGALGAGADGLDGLDLFEPGFTEPPLGDPEEAPGGGGPSVDPEGETGAWPRLEEAGGEAASGEAESFRDEFGEESFTPARSYTASESFTSSERFSEAQGMGQVVPLPVSGPRAGREDEVVSVPPEEAAAPSPAAAAATAPAAAPVPAAQPAAAATPRRDPLAAVRDWLPAGLALLAAAAVVAGLVARPALFLLPLPWQASERQQYVSVQRQAEYRTIDGAAKTFFLLEGRFPDNLDRLVEASLLHRHDLVGPEGRGLEIEARPESYVLQPRLPEGTPPDPASVVTDAITGNFLLDPEYLTARPEETRPPLVLLD